jgi:D-alanyl-D-alanine carboxypeptidase (penicillin-binding protein 5/6)
MTIEILNIASYTEYIKIKKSKGITMKTLKYLFIAFFLLLLISQLIYADNKPAINARSAILIDSNTGKVLYSKSSLAIMAPASTTKIMTAILTLEKLKMDRIVTVRPEAAAKEGTSMHLKIEEKRTVRELLYGLMLQSGNDAAVALAEAVSGSEKNFTALMNQKAKLLGMKNTYFKNASGLPTIGHYTTAYDMAVLTRYAMKNPAFTAIVGTKQKDIPGPKPGEVRALKNHNKLLWQYPYAIGVKTGYTVSAGGCLVSAASYNGKTLINIVLKTHTIYNDSIKLFNYGFNLHG